MKGNRRVEGVPSPLMKPSAVNLTRGVLDFVERPSLGLCLKCLHENEPNDRASVDRGSQITVHQRQGVCQNERGQK